MAANVGTAYVTVLPSMKGFGAAVSKEFQGAGTAASAAFGKTAAKGFEQAGSESGGKFLSSVTSKLKGVVNVATKAFGIVGAVATGAFMKGGIDRALNIEQAQFKLKGMGMDVESVMASCNTAVSGTAFGLAAAATAAANMGAAGVAAGDQMTRSLQAATGVAAMGGVELERVGGIFAKVAANGKLSGDELLQMSDMGVNALSALSSYLGKSQADVRAMVTKGQIDFQTFSDAMYATFGTAAYGANDTFSGAMANVQAALSRVSAKFADPALKGLKSVFQATIPAINAVSARLDPLVSGFSVLCEQVSGQVVAGINAFTQALNDTGNPITALKAALDAVVPAGSRAREIFDTVCNAAQGLLPVAQEAGSILAGIFDTAAAAAGKFAPVVQDAANKVVAFLANGGAQATAFGAVFAGAFALLATPIGQLAAKLPAIIGLITSLGGSVSGIVGTLSLMGGNFAKLVSQMGLLKGSMSFFSGMPALLGALVSPVGLAVAGIAALAAGFAYCMATSEEFRNTVMNLVSGIGASLLPVFAQLGTTLASIASAVLPVIVSAVQQLAPIFGQVVALVLQVAAALAPMIAQLMGSLLPCVTTIIGVLANIVSAVMPGLVAILNVVMSVLQAVIPVVMSIISVVVSVASQIIAAVTPIVALIGTVVTAVVSAASMVASTLAAVVSTVVSVFGAIAGTVTSVIATVVSVVTSGFQAAGSAVSAAVNAIGSFIAGLLSTVSSIFNSIAQTVTSCVQNAFSAAQSAFNSMLSAIGSVCGQIYGVVQSGFSSAISYITGLASQAWHWGADIINGIVGGIQSMIGNVSGAVGQVADTIRSFLHFSEPDVGPLSDFHTYMPDMMGGMASGIKQNMGAVRKAVSGVADEMAQGLGIAEPQLSVAGTSPYAVGSASRPAASQGAGNSYTFTGDITIACEDAQQVHDMGELARAIMKAGGYRG